LGVSRHEADGQEHDENEANDPIPKSTGGCSGSAASVKINPMLVIYGSAAVGYSD
jgi:hypothetical protein